MIRRRVLESFERAEAATSDAERDACLTFAVIGAGPTGVELAGTLAEIARHTLASEFRHIDTRKARVLLIEAGPRVLGDVRRRASRTRRAHSSSASASKCTPAQPVTEIGAGFLRFGGQRIAARTILWAAGVAASPLGKQLGAELDRAGRVRVQTDLSACPRIRRFSSPAISRASSRTASPCPAWRPPPSRWAPARRDNILARIAGRATAPFRYTGLRARSPPSAAIRPSRNCPACASPASWRGGSGCVLHIYFLIGFRSRLIVLINWAWAYFTYARGARIILGNESERGDHGSEEKSSA